MKLVLKEMKTRKVNEKKKYFNGSLLKHLGTLSHNVVIFHVFWRWREITTIKMPGRINSLKIQCVFPTALADC